ncbi:MAG: SulP family inorganic anion transporter [Acidimicrobiales bacterium]
MTAWLDRLGRPTSGDVVAGASVGLVLLPQSMAYAELAGLPAYVGLFAAVLPPLLAALFVSSPYLQTGPTAMMALLTFGALEGRAALGSDEYIKLAALLALIVGVTRVVLGVLRLGPVAYLMSEPVLLGFTSAAAVLILASQLPVIFDVTAEGDGVLARGWWTLTHPADWEPAALLLALLTLVLMLAGPRIHRLFPGVLVAVALGTALTAAGVYEGSTVGDLPGGFLSLSVDVPWGDAPGLIIPGMIIALVGFAEPASIARTFASADRQRWDASKELVSQGVANLASSVSGAFPVGGSFSRSSLNRMAGATTRWSGAVTGLVVLLFLPVSPIFEDLPRAILGAIVFGAGYKLIQARAMVGLWTTSPPQAALAWTTFAVTLMMAPRVDLGIMVGVALAILSHVWLETTVRAKVDYDDGTLRIQPRGVIWFVSAPALEDLLIDHLAEHPEADRLVIDLGQAGRIDYTGAAALARVLDDARTAGLEAEVVAIPAHSQRTLAALLADEDTDDI